jgi:polysaccharide export outer membrane protein
MIRNILGLLVIAVLIPACISRRDINYLQDPSLSNTAKLYPNRKFEYRVQVNDILSIRVLGLDDENSKQFNIESTQGMSVVNDAQMYVNGFSVDKAGNVRLPTVGKLKIQGLTLGEAQDLIQRKINEYFTNATVILKLVSFRVSVLGGVERPGAYLVYNNQITLLEALALAGGPSEFGDKRHVTLMRQSDQGTQALNIDLGRMDVLSSEYYYLLPNDVVYVTILKARPGRMNLEMLSVFLTAISVAAVVYTVIQNQQAN